MTQKYNIQKFMSFSTKTPKRYKLTHDDLFLHLNHPHIIFYHFKMMFPINTIKKCLYPKYSTFCTKTCQKWM